MEEFEVLPGIGEFETEKLEALGFTRDDVRRMIAAITVDCMVEIKASDVIDEASVVIEAENILGNFSD